MVDAQKSSRRDLDALAAQIHQWNSKWWHDMEGKPIQRDVGTMVMLIISELAEAMEGRRKSKPGAPMMDDKLPHREMAEVELADVSIRVLDILGSGQFRDSNDKDKSIGETAQHYRERNYIPERELRVGQDGSKLLTLTQIAVNCASNWSGWKTMFGSLVQLHVSVEYVAEMWGYDLYAAIDEKNQYNLTRHDHSIEARQAEGGKAW